MNTDAFKLNAIRMRTVPSTGMLGLLLVVLVIIVLLSGSTRAAALGHTKAE